jgi:hypothetical protein
MRVGAVLMMAMLAKSFAKRANVIAVTALDTLVSAMDVIIGNSTQIALMINNVIP